MPGTASNVTFGNLARQYPFGWSFFQRATRRHSALQCSSRFDPEQFDTAVRTIEEKDVRKVSELSRREIGRYIFILPPYA